MRRSNRGWETRTHRKWKRKVSEQEGELPYHPLIEGQNTPGRNWGWGDEYTPACTECGKHTDDGVATYAYGWLCPEGLVVLER